jgi:uncharacterized protein (TIGR03089 family)
VRSLTRATAGLAGERDPAQPLLTLLDGPARVELSGATTANWVAKSANLLVDGLGAPARVGLLLPLHWQTVVLVLAGVASGAQVVVAGSSADLAGCEVAFTCVEHASAALDAGVQEVLAVSLHPLGAPLPSVPAGVLDHAREVPGHADHWGGPPPAGVDVTVAGQPLGPLPELGLTAVDRVLTDVRPGDPQGLRTLLSALSCGAALVLVPDPAGIDLRAAAAAERVTATAGPDVPGLRAAAAGA